MQETEQITTLRGHRSNALRAALKNPIIFFTASRYVTFVFKFLAGVLIAKHLGPFFFGIWSFLILVQQYLSYGSMGIEYSLNVRLCSPGPIEEGVQARLIGSSLTLISAISLIILVGGGVIQILRLPIFPEYGFSKFSFSVGLIVALGLFQQLFVNVYRYYNRLSTIIITEIVLTIFPFFALFFFEGEHLIKGLLLSVALGSIIACLIYFFKPPIRFRFNINSSVILGLVFTGLSLLGYNFSYYLITAVGRTIVSQFYGIEQMGYYSFAFSFSNAITLGLNSISWVIYPILLKRQSDESDNEGALRFTERVTQLYRTLVFLVVFLAIVLMPVAFKYFQEYRSSEPVLAILLLSQGILCSSFGYASLAIARKKQVHLAGAMLLIVLFMALLGLAFARLGLDLTSIATVTFVGSFLFSAALLIVVDRIVPSKRSWNERLLSLLPPSYLASIVFVLCDSLILRSGIGNLAGFAIFALFNSKDIRDIFSVVGKPLLV